MHVEHAGWPISAPDVVPGVCAPFPMFSSVQHGGREVAVGSLFLPPALQWVLCRCHTGHLRQGDRRVTCHSHPRVTAQ